MYPDSWANKEIAWPDIGLVNNKNKGISKSFKLSSENPEWIIRDKIINPVPKVSIKPAACTLLKISGNFIKPTLPDRIKKQPRNRKKIVE